MKLIINSFLFALFIASSVLSSAQTTNIPDDNFEQRLIDLGYDSGPLDNQVLTANISGLTLIDVSYNNISDLTGIEDFTSLTYLNCSNNNIDSLDVSANTALTVLDCGYNQLDSLSLLTNTLLTELRCGSNQLTSLDISANTALTQLHCYINQLSSLNLSNNTSLSELLCFSNLITSLDVSANTALTQLHCYLNQLTNLDLSSNTLLTDLDCNGNILTNLNISACTNLELLNCNDNNLTSLDVSSNTALLNLYCFTNHITSLDVSTNTSLLELGCANNQIGSLDVSTNTALTKLFASLNQFTSLDVSNNTALTVLYCYSSHFTSLDVHLNTALTELRCHDNQLTNLDLSANPNLERLSVHTNQLTNLDLSDKTALIELACFDNNLTSLDMRNGNNANVTDFNSIGNPDLTCIYVDNKTADYHSDWIKDVTSSFKNTGDDCIITYTYIPDNFFEHQLFELGYDVLPINDSVRTDVINQIDSLDVSGVFIEGLTGIEDFTSLIYLNCSNNNIDSLDLSANTALASLNCSNNNLTSLNISANTALVELSASNNQLTSIDVTANTALTQLYCDDNLLTSLDVSANTALDSVNCSSNQITSLDFSTNVTLAKIFCQDNVLTSLDVRNGNNANVTSFNASGNAGLTCIYVDDMTAGYLSGWTKDATSNFVNSETECLNLFTYVPDDNFEQALIDLGYDSGSLDDYVLTSDIDQIDSLDVSGSSINVLTGIEDFTALTYLNCSNNNLASLNISANTALVELSASSNQLTSIDVTANTALTQLYCDDNQLTSLDVSTNTALDSVNCSSNQITSLDFSTNVTLAKILCQDNVLTSLDVRNGNNANVTSFNASVNTGLTCIYVDDMTAGYLSGWTKDATSNFVNSETECLNLFTYVPDDNFEQALIDLGYDSGSLDDYVLTSDIDQIDSLDVSGSSINVLTGIEDFTALTYLNCSNNNLTSLNISANTTLVELSASSNQLTSIDVTANTALTQLYCDDNQLTSLDVSANTALTLLYCNENQLTSLDVSTNTALIELNTQNNQLTSLDVSANTALDSVNCSSNQITSLDFSTNVTLAKIFCQDNVLTSLDVRNGNNANVTSFNASGNAGLTCIYVDDMTAGYLSGWTKDATSNFVNSETECLNLFTYVPDDNFEQALIDLGYDSGSLDDYILTSDIDQIDSLDVSGSSINVLTGIEDFTALTYLNCSNNNLTSLNISANTALVELSASSNQLTSIDVTTNTALTQLYCDDNQLTSLDVSANTVLDSVDCSLNQITSLDFSTNVTLAKILCQDNVLTSLDVRNGNNANVTSFNASGSAGLTCIYVDDMTAGYLSGWTKDATSNFANSEADCSNLFTYVPDDNFEQALIDLGYDSGSLDDYVLTSDIDQIDSLDVSGSSINVLTGVEDFTALTYLNCSNNNLASLNISANTALVELFASSNQLTSIDVTTNTALTRLVCDDNKLTSLGVSTNTALIELYTQNNQLTSLDVSANTALDSVNCSSNQITSLDFSTNVTLGRILCQNNVLTSLDVRNGNNADVTYFNASGNAGLTCIYVDDKTAGYLSGWTKDATSNFVNSEADCSNLFTYVPDDNFEQALIDLGYDTAPLDDYVLTTNINGLTDLDVSSKNISDLTGIENFTSLTLLRSNDNQLTSLNISENTALIELYIQNNQLSSLDVSANTALTLLDCNNNQLTSLDVSANKALDLLDCNDNQLTSLDVSDNTALTQLDCDGNLLTFLDVRNGNNANVTSFNASGNAGLTCIYVDDKTAGYLSDWIKDATTSFVNLEAECGNTSVNELITNGDYSIYPNPTDGLINFDFSKDNVQKIKIIDQTGKIIVEEKNIKQNKTIDLSDCAKGMYIVILETERGSFSSKIVKE